MKKFIRFYQESPRLHPMRSFNRICSSINWSQPDADIVELTRFSHSGSPYSYHHRKFSRTQRISGRINYRSTLEKTIKTRRTKRIFSSKPVLFGTLGKILDLSFGVSLKKNNMVYRNYPSAGALYPLDMFVIALNVDGLNPGAYFYDYFENKLKQIRHYNVCEKIERYFLSTQNFEKFSFAIILAANLFISGFKYGNRGYRYALLDAGHVMQNILLLGTSYKLSMVPIGGFDEKLFNKILKLNDEYSTAIYICLVGHSPKP